MTRWLIFVVVAGCILDLARCQDDKSAAPMGLMKDIMDMFVGTSSDSSGREQRRRQAEPDLLPPFGINRQLPTDETVRRGAQLADTVVSLFRPSSKTASESPALDSRHPLMPRDPELVNANAKNWAGLAKDVFYLFGVQPTTTTTTTPSPMAAGLQMLNPRFYQDMIPGWMQTLNPFTGDQQQREFRRSPSVDSGQNLFGQLTGVFTPDNQATRVDTGGNTFDRLVVRENVQQPDSPLGSLMGGNWKERGIQWTDGNLKVVNKNGNKLLGSDLASHDRSIDIPVQRWIDIANNIVSSYANPDTSLFSLPPKHK